MTKKEKEILSKNEYRVEIREARCKDRKGLEFIMSLGYIMAYLKNYSGEYILTVLEKIKPKDQDLNLPLPIAHAFSEISISPKGED